MARIATWPEKILAPEEALNLYRLISSLQRSDAFQHCHVFTGTVIGNIPHVQWEGKVTNLPKVVCSFLALPYKKKQCKTFGCVNPFHYINYDDLPTAGALMEPIVVPTPDLSSYVETLRYYIEENDLESPTLQQLRALIPTEDIPDDILEKAYHEL